MLEPVVHCSFVVDGGVSPRVAHHETFEVDVRALLLLVPPDDAGGGVGDVMASVALARDPEVVACKLREFLVETLHEEVAAQDVTKRQRGKDVT